ncbi:RlmE family RNA methyltransferase [Alphaproteobacteria bacterium endosymbiont of Tiliacea citrago]|uniref:RlmE family RNA methyltransferase n=1 Tax=Alphaproteobacteria bacterium endosymbiont of Tiliacea citrago TaxID=3077944 RepID=UPI00313F039E
MKRRDKHQWMKDRMKDPFFLKAKKEGYRARSAYKLIEIQEKFNIIPKTGNVLDLGCAPGAWIQVLQKFSKASLFGIDLLEIAPISNLNFLKGDIFSEEANNFLQNKKFNLILSDIAPNCCGNKRQDHLKIMALADRVLEFVLNYLEESGNFCIKIFDGSDVTEYIASTRTFFKSVKFFKPKSSSKESNEFYLVCSNFIKTTKTD